IIRKLEAAEAELDAYRDANLISVIGKDAFVAGLEKRQQAIDDARAELQKAQAASVAMFDPKLVATWSTLTTRERRKIIAAGIERVICRRARVRGRASDPSHRLQLIWR